MMRIIVIAVLILIGFPNVLNGQLSGFFDYIDFRITSLNSINSVESDISPFFVEKELYFSSVREEFFGDKKRQEKNSLFYDIYRVQIDEKGNPVTERELVPGFGNMFHEGPAAWCKKTGELFVTINNIPEGARMSGKRNINLRLVIMKEFNGEWVVTHFRRRATPEEEKELNMEWIVTTDFSFNNPGFNFFHPAISVTGDTLIFSSDLDGGFGKSDLYMSIREEGQWTEPINLGERINTAGNEMFPTFGPGGMLFFSSDGHEQNYGRLDIYYTTLSGNSKSVNIGSKLNSAFDDFGLIIHPTKKFGYFSSNRNNAKKDDIFHVEFFPIMENIRGKVIFHHNDEPVRNALVYLQDCNGKQIKAVYSDNFGNFEFEAPKGTCYQVYAEKEGFSSELVNCQECRFVELHIEQIVNYQIVVQDFENTNTLSEAEVTCGELHWKSDITGIIKAKFDATLDCAVNVARDGYFDYLFDLSPERFGPGIEISDTVRLFRKEAGRMFLLKSVDYYMNTWILAPKSEPDLNHIVKLLKDNPTLRIEISAHTDSRLEDQYNMWLSQKRADSVSEYLVQNGAPKERIVAKGYGETRLLNHCANGVICSEALHLVNRRTEMVILEY